MAAFTWGRGGTRLTPEEIERQRLVAEHLMSQGADYSPVRHWTQGAARAVSGVSGGLAMRKADQAAAANAAENEQMLASLTGGAPPTTEIPVNAPPSATAPEDDLVERVIQQESAGNPHAVSPKGAMGLMQVMPATARDPGFGVKPMDPAKAFDPEENRRFGTEYLTAMQNRYGGDTEAALVAYNAGPGRADQFVKTGRNKASLPKETQDYIAKIMGGGSPQNPIQTAQAGGMNPAVLKAMTSPYASPQVQAIAKMMLGQQIEQNDPMRQLQMQKLQQDLAQGPAKPADVQEYEYYANQERAAGRQPKAFNEYQIGLKEAGRPSTSVNIDQKAQGALEKTLGESVGKAFGTMFEEGTQAGADLGQIERLRGLLANSPGGVDAGLTNLAAGFGIELGEGASEVQAANAIINYLTPRQRVPGTGASSDKDVAMFKAALPSVMNLPGGNSLIMDTMQGMAEHKRAMGDIAGAVVMGEMDPKEAVKAIRSLPDPFEKFKAAQASNQGPVKVQTPEEARKLPKGTRILLPDGSEGVVP